MHYRHPDYLGVVPFVKIIIIYLAEFLIKNFCKLFSVLRFFDEFYNPFMSTSHFSSFIDFRSYGIIGDDGIGKFTRLQNGFFYVFQIYTLTEHIDEIFGSTCNLNPPRFDAREFYHVAYHISSQS